MFEYRCPQCGELITVHEKYQSGMLERPCEKCRTGQTAVSVMAEFRAEAAKSKGWLFRINRSIRKLLGSAERDGKRKSDEQRF